MGHSKPDNATKVNTQSRIKIYSDIQSNYAIIKVENTGKPISEDVLKNIFQMNSNDETYNSKEVGTGIGLYLSLEFMKRMDGKIECQSNETSTIFSIFVPLADN